MEMIYDIFYFVILTYRYVVISSQIVVFFAELILNELPYFEGFIPV